MTTGEARDTTTDCDALISELHALKRTAGEPSYAEVARRIMLARIEAGASPHEARIARSTVHNAFAFGRSRINIPLTREVIRALDGDEAVVDAWLNPPAPEPEPSTTTERIPSASTQLVVTVLLACVVVNLVGRNFVDFFSLPLHLDMVGTAVAAIAIGPWRGALVGLATNLLGAFGSGFISVPFALVNVVGALVWGYGVRQWGMGKSLPRFFSLNLITAVACSVVAIPITVAFVGPDLRVGRDVITEIASETFDTFLVAVSFSNLLTSTGDKLISGFTALVVVSMLPLALRARSRLVFITNGQ